MDSERRQLLRALAQAFHDAILQTDFRGTGLNLKDFPHECCHYGCNLLGAYLFGNGFHEIRKFSGNRSDGESGEHLWLGVEGTVVDITSHQFADAPRDIVVDDRSPWHEARNGKIVPLGIDGEALTECFHRVRANFNERFDQLFDNLEARANSLLSILE